MTFFGPLRPAHTRIPITRNSARPGTVARILPILAASFALAVGAGSAKAAGPHAPVASDTLKVSLSAPPGGTVAEGATGHFEVSVEGSTADGAVKVKYSVSGTAVSGEDYKALSGEATVAKGENTARIALEALDDGILDKGETVVLALTGATGPGPVVVDGTAATAMIADEGTVTIALAAVSDTIGEGSVWSSAVTMSTPVADRVSVRWWTSDGTAVAGRDYVAADEVVSFQPGETTKPVEVRTLRDDNAEPVEVFHVSVGPPGGVSGASGGFNFAGAQSAFIECSVDFSPPDPRVFMLTLEVKNGKFIPVKAGTVIGTVSANTTDGIPYYELGGADKNKFSINSLTAEITTTAALAADLYDLEVTVHDECGAQASVDVSVLVKQPNRSPTGEAMPPDSVDVGKTKTVDASNYFSDPDGDVLTYTAKSSDATVLGVSVSGSEVTYSGKAEGGASVTVTAEDPDGLSASQSFQVKVKKPNDPPVANAGLDQVVTGPTTVSLDGSKSYDPNGDKLKYEWTGAQGAPDLSNPTTTKPSFRAEAVTDTTEYEFTLIVTDDPGGLSDTDAVIVKVVPPACKIDVGDGDFTVPEDDTDVGTVGVTASHCGDLEYELEGAGAGDVSVAAVSGSNDNAKITGNFDFKRRSSYSLTLTVSEVGGTASDDGDVDIAVTKVNEPPEVDDEIADQTLYVGDPPNSEEIDLSNVFSDPDGDALGYTVKSSNAAVATATVSGSTLTVTAKGKGETTVTVTATDGDLEADDAFDVEVRNREPVVDDPIDDLTLYVGDLPNSEEIDISSVFKDPDGDGLKYTVESSNTAVATAVLSGTKLTVTATGKGRARVTLTADDEMGGTEADVFEVRVPNRKPTRNGTIPDDAVAVGESGSVDVLLKFEDPDGDDLDFSAVSSNKTVLGVSVSGSKVTYEGLKEGSATVTVTAEDTGGLTATQQFDVEVYEPTRPCTIKVSDAALSVAENAPVGTPMNSDVSVEASDCGTLRYALKGTGSGDFSVSAAGAGDDDARIKVAKRPNHEARDAYALKLTVSSGSVSDTRDVDISVTDVNEAPRRNGTIGRQTIQVGTPGSVDVANYFTDEDAGDRLTFTSESSATGRLTVNASGSPVKLTGAAAGSATVTVTARDRGGLTATQVFSVKVDPAPTPCGITVSDGALSVAENARVGDGVDGKVGVTATGDCGTLSYALTGTGSGDFSVAAAGGSDDDAKIKVAKKLNHEARDSYDLTLTVSWGSVSGAGDVDISVTDVNEAPKPKGAIGNRTIRIGRPGSVDVTNYFTDEDAGDRLTFASESSATGRLTVNASGSPVKLTGVAAGSATVTVTARDSGGLTATQVFSVKVDPAPTTPCGITVADGALSVPEDAGVGDGVDGKVGVETTGDCGTLSYALAGTGSGDFSVAAASASDDDAKIGVAKALDHETTASYALTLTVSEAGGDASSDGDVAITVTDVNEAPEVAGAIPTLTVSSGGSKTVDVSARFRDPDGDALTYEATSSKESAATVRVDGGEVTVTGVSPGGSEVTVTARDAHGATVSQGFAVTVVNEAPEVVSAIPALTVGAGSSKAVDVTAHFRDPNGDALTYEASSSKETVATVKVDDGEVTVTGVSPGESQVTVTARDAHGAAVSQGFTVTVGPDNEAPVVERALPDLTVAADSSVVVDVSAHFRDPDGDTLSYAASSSNEGAATVKVDDDEVTVTGVSRGESQVTVTASDGRGGSVSQDFSVTVPNRAPSAVGSLGRVSVYKGDWARVDVSGAFSDPDGDGLKYRMAVADDGVVTPPVVVDGSWVTFKGVSRKATTVTVTADDGHGGTVVQKFGVEVPNRHPVPTGSIKRRTIAPGERVTATLSDYFRDIDGDTLTYSGEALTPGVVDVSVDGAEITVLGVARGRTWVSGYAHDGHGGTGTQAFLVTVTNGAPSFGADAYEREVAENSAAGTAVGEPVAATDGDGDAVTHGFVAGGDEALFGIDGPSGQITVAEGTVLDYEGGETVYMVSVEASDGGLADTVGVTIRVTDVPAPGRPDAPTVTGGTEQVTATWSAPANEGPEITDYDLRYRAKADGEWTDAPALGEVLTHMITGLEAGTAYLVQVRAESSEGAGEWSEPGEGATLTPNRAPAFAQDAHEREIAENSPAGTAVGDPVTAEDDDGDDLAYSFVAGGGAPFEIDGSSGQITVAEGAALDYESGDNVYALSVEASDGTLADTAGVTVRVTDIPAPGKPDAPVVTGGTAEVAVSWSAPANDGPEITNYDLRYRAKADGEWTDVSALGAVLTHTIAGLDAGTAYLVQVRASSSEGAGEWSGSGEGTTVTPNRAPAFAADAYEREIAENSAAGTAVGEPVAADDDDGDDLAYSFVTGGGTLFEIAAGTGRITVAADAALDYESGDTLYAVSVEASDGTLADTAAVTIRVTDVPAPGKPGAPVVKGGKREVAVSWSAPSNEGPEITNYDVRYRASAEEEWAAPAVLGTVLTHTIAGLDEGTAYSVQVRASSSEGAGEWSEPGEGTTEAPNRAPAFDADAYEREVAENSAVGTAVGEPVTADDDGDELTYGFVSGGDDAPFEIETATGRITVAADAALNYESGDTLHVVSVEASDGELADTASVTIRITNADDPGEVTLSPEVARVGVEITATLADEDGVRSAGRRRRWQRSANGRAWNDVGAGRMYNPVTADAGRWLRAVFTYTDGHGPGKRAVSAAVRIEAASAAPSFDADAHEREVPENSPGGTNVGAPVTATDPDGTSPSYSLVDGGDDAPFEIGASTGQITVAADAALNYESADTLFTVSVEASDGALADTASVTIRVTDADDPGSLALSPEVARVGVEITMTLTDEDGVRNAGRKRKWQRSRNGNAWNDIGTGRMYNPVTADAGRWLRAVFTYTDGHGPGKRAVSAAVKVLAANAAPSFPTTYEREVPENSPGGTKVGAPVAATDPDGTSPSYSLVGGGDEALFEIGASTGQIAVAADAALNYESADTLFTVRVEASDGDLADTASVRIRVTNADDPGKIALSADVARVGVRLTATLMDEDRSIERSKMRTWQRSPDGAQWTMIVQGAARRFYTPTAADRGKYLRAVFTYTDGHGPGKRAESAAVAVVGASTPVVSFGADGYTAAAGGSADVAVLLSPAASAALSVEVVAGDSAHTVTFQAGARTASLPVGTAGLSASDTVDVRFGTLPDGVAVGVPATTRIIVAAVAGDRVSRAVVEDGSPTELEIEYAHSEYSAVAGGPRTGIALRMSPAADRRVAVPLTATHAASVEPILPDSVVFHPGDSLVAFMLEVPTGSSPGLLALGLGALPEAVTAGTAASATVAIAAPDTGALRDEAFDLGLAVFGRAVAEGARQAIGARIDAVMRPGQVGSGASRSASASEWAGRAAGTLASLAGLPLGGPSATGMVRRSGSVDLPTGREAAERLLPRISFATALGPQSPQGTHRFGLWAEGSAQSFRGEPGIDYDGSLRALTVGADARIGSSALLGVSVMRSDGDLDYGHRAAEGSLGHAMNSVHPYLFLQPSSRIGLWAMAGYGSGDVRDDDRQGDSGASLRMLSGGVKVPLAGRGAFGLAVKGDAFTVDMRASDQGGEGSVSRARAMLEASWTAGGLKLATEAGARHDAGNADTGGGAETGASIGYAGRGLDLGLRGRLALGSGRHREWGAALRLAFDPGTRGEGFRLAVSPRHGHDQSGIHGLMDGGTFQAMTPATGQQGKEWRLDAEAGYALKQPGGEGALDGYTRLAADGRTRSWSFGTRYHVSQTLRLGVEGSRSRMPGQDSNIGLRFALDFTF